jgi:hypothetical protein
MFADGVPVVKALDKAVEKARAAMFAVLRRCHELGLYNVALRCHLFNSLVLPVMSYGCELWAPYALRCLNKPKFNWGSNGAAERLHMIYLRAILCLPTAAPTAAIMHETGRVPIMHLWLQRALRFWNRIMARPADDLVRMAAVQSMALSSSRVSWASAVMDCVRCIDLVSFESMQVHPTHGVAVSSIIEKVRDRWHSVLWKPLISFQQNLGGVGMEVRACSDAVREGFKLYVYSRWHRRPVAPFRKGENWIYHVHDVRHVAAIARYRLGCCWLNIERMRYGVHQVPRSQRTCPCCSVNAVEDEMHVFECPAYSSLQLQQRFAGVSSLVNTTDGAMYARMNCADGGSWRRLAHLLFCMYKCRESVVNAT